MMENSVNKRPAIGSGGLIKNLHFQTNKRNICKQAQKSSWREDGFIDFKVLNARLRPYLETLICNRLLPTGRREGHEWVALNPTRTDRRKGSFKVNLTTSKWADFATGDKGGNIISLWAYVRGLQPIEAARELLTIIGVHYG